VVLGWTVLQPSARERRWLQVAVAACLAVAVALAFAAVTMDPRHPSRVGTAAAAAVVASLWGIVRLRRTSSDAFEVCVRNGRVELRARDAGEAPAETPTRCVFAAPWLITFRSGSNWVRVWPDSVPPDVFRRLHACVRWERPAGTDSKQTPGPRPENETDA